MCVMTYYNVIEHEDTYVVGITDDDGSIRWGIDFDEKLLLARDANRGRQLRLRVEAYKRREAARKAKAKALAAKAKAKA